MKQEEFTDRLAILLGEARKDINVAWLVGILQAAAFHMLYRKELE